MLNAPEGVEVRIVSWSFGNAEERGRPAKGA